MSVAGRFIERYGMTRTELRKALNRRQSGRCDICKQQLPKRYVTSAHVNLDHRQSRAHGGSDELSNLGLVHMRCNLDKGEGCAPGVDCRICWPSLLPSLED